ncbi:hypothetical protein PPL_06606 [Heterostelium album PN500]|uniref:Uncharacterized protein n=1 Tax=Heterostelium pallidum (strain ATCC 26659 / Pp 5 / PN500) TaxID=670386 RepID=D3BF73_HETP5|nr:hypothetical protein PPL_06606 [Heterostelium album PN500]EFA79787.1 hypothetical protein PPL_06606 [Heterostelium album PN500]|eukprot:XP_020431908.1 hypothetical protein PPL_06606 [Heterostelium album PN500]
MLSYTDQTLKEFPYSHLLWKIASVAFAKSRKWNDAIVCISKARELMVKMEKYKQTPQSGHYVPCVLIDYTLDLLAFQQIYEKDDPLRPNSYYELSNLMLCQDNQVQATKYYYMGKESEKDIVPCFLPYKNNRPQVVVLESLGEFTGRIDCFNIDNENFILGFTLWNSMICLLAKSQAVQKQQQALINSQLNSIQGIFLFLSPTD